MKKLKNTKHPIQPIGKDEHGVVRFKRNAIVCHLLDHGGIDLNQIAALNFSREDREQFAQLIGYSHSGAHDLSYMSSEVLAAADADAKLQDLMQWIYLNRRNGYVSEPALLGKVVSLFADPNRCIVSGSRVIAEDGEPPTPYIPTSVIPPEYLPQKPAAVVPDDPRWELVAQLADVVVEFFCPPWCDRARAIAKQLRGGA